MEQQFAIDELNTLACVLYSEASRLSAIAESMTASEMDMYQNRIDRLSAIADKAWNIRSTLLEKE